MFSDHHQEHWREECAVFGIWNHSEVATFTTLGLHALQHRGHEASGITTFDGQNFFSHKDFGHISKIFTDSKVIEGLKGFAAIGHNRYSTTGEQSTHNIQPFLCNLDNDDCLAIAHNGNIVNAIELKTELSKKGHIFTSTSDTEVFLHLIALTNPSKPFHERMIEACSKIKGAYSLVLLTKHGLYAMRDSHGFRPLSLGKLENSYIIASETVAFDIIGAQNIRDVEPGEILHINTDGIISYKNALSPQPHKFCIFEYIYFARPDSVIANQSVYEIRKKIGHTLALENHVDADIVVPVPDSGVPAAIGYSHATQVPLELGIIRNHYVGRTFIEPKQSIRDFGVRLKHNANLHTIKGKKIILVDDSIVRGTTSKKIVAMLRQAGAKEIHMRIASPSIHNPCFYGVDTPDKKDLLAARNSVEEIAKIIDVDSLKFISLEGLYQSVAGTDYCDACFTGNYPIEPYL